MVRKPDPTPEITTLRALIREAHEATQGLRQAIRDALALQPGLVTKFEQYHDREIKLLSNFFTEESNRHAAALNADIERARMMINETIMAGEAVFDRETMTVSITWGKGSFDASVPLPYPEVTEQEKTQ